jgi:hypothetical protein
MVSSRVVMVSRYESITHSMVAISVLKYLERVGNAIITILESRVAMNIPIETTNMARHLYLWSDSFFIISKYVDALMVNYIFFIFSTPE